jgi:hypothetical protein
VSRADELDELRLLLFAMAYRILGDEAPETIHSPVSMPTSGHTAEHDPTARRSVARLLPDGRLQ